ncbi:MAG: histidine--tRNA ligase [Deltaproteobacteria bacterium]|jgi:histidyl-tRNA synthetase|nr:histidine--tRNA ligase [Deltaproteobacteria bacterium]
MPSLTAIRGFKDILPKDIPYWRLIEEKAREIAKRHSYREIRPPVLERTALFSRGIGEATDIVEKEMYTFEDRSGDKITMRPEATAGVTRAAIEHNLLEAGRALKVFSLGPMFRYERPQKGRLRQFHQLDVEAYGDPGPYVDAEVIGLLYEFLKSLGLKDLILVLNTLGCPVCRPAYRQALVSYLEAHFSDLCPDCQRRMELNPLRVLDCKNPGCRAIVLNSPKIGDFLCEPCRTHFSQLTEALSILEIESHLDPYLVRGLDYYTRTAFEVHAGGLGAQNAVAGGGRYDGLVSALGGPDTPGIGFAVGLERLVLLLAQNELIEEGPEWYLAILSQEAIELSLKIASSLRANGHAVACDWEPGSLKSRLKRADKMHALKVLMLGDDEVKGSYVTVRDMATGEQEKLPIESFTGQKNAI